MILFQGLLYYYNMSINVLWKRPTVNIYVLLLAKMQKCVIWQKVNLSSGVHTMSQGGGNTFHKGHPLQGIVFIL